MSKFDRKIYFGFGITLVALFALAMVSYFSITHVMTAEDALISNHAHEFYLAERLRVEKEGQFSLMPVYVIRGDEEILGQFHQARGRLLGILDELMRGAGDPQAMSLLEKIRDIEKQLFEKGIPVLEMRRRGASVAQVDEAMAMATGELSGQLNLALDDFIAYEQNQFDAARAAASHTTSKLYWGFVLSSGIAGTLALLSCLLLVNVLRKKLKEDRRRDLVLERETQLSQARKETVEIVSHDLRNPLATARMSLELIAEKLGKAREEDALLNDGLQITTRSLSSMETLINNLLDHAKIEAGRLALRREHCDAAAFLTDIHRRFEPLARRRGLNFRLFVNGPLPRVAWDQPRVEQILSNLLGNAFKFSQAGGEVALRAEVDGSYLRISVRDSGPGIEHDEIEHVFDRYWQAQDRAHQGQGLGLAIAKAIIGAHDGRIWAESKPGQGATFIFMLPIVPASTNPLAEAPEANAPGY